MAKESSIIIHPLAATFLFKRLQSHIPEKPPRSHRNASFAANLAGGRSAVLVIERWQSHFDTPHGGHRGFKKNLNSDRRILASVIDDRRVAGSHQHNN